MAVFYNSKQLEIIELLFGHEYKISNISDKSQIVPDIN